MITDNNWKSQLQNDTIEHTELPEQKFIVNLATNDDIDLFSKFSSWRVLKRVFAYYLRFILNSKSK